MATVYDPNKEKEDDQNGTVVSQQPLSSSSGGQSSAPVAPGTPKTPSSSGRFVNLQNYLQGNTSSDNTTGKLTGKLNEGMTTASNSLDSNAAATGAAIAKSQSDSNSLINQASGQLKDLNTTDEATVQKGLNAKYQGPTALQNSDSLNQQNQQLQENSKLSKNASGQQELLTSNFGRPTYNQGDKSLDTLFLSSPDAAGQLQDYRKRANNFGASLTNQQQTIANTADAAQNDVRNNVTGLKDNINTNLSNLTGTLQGQVDAKNAAVSALNGDGSTPEQRAVQVLQNSGLKVENSDGAGNYYIDTGEGRKLAVNLPQLINAGVFNLDASTNASLGNVDPKSLATLNMLNRLSGKAEIAPTAAVTDNLTRGVNQNNSGDLIGDIMNSAQEYDSLADRPTQGVRQLDARTGQITNQADLDAYKQRELEAVRQQAQQNLIDRLKKYGY